MHLRGKRGEMGRLTFEIDGLGDERVSRMNTEIDTVG